jgi:hypothetical protein
MSYCASCRSSHGSAAIKEGAEELDMLRRAGLQASRNFSAADVYIDTTLKERVL